MRAARTCMRTRVVAVAAVATLALGLLACSGRPTVRPGTAPINNDAGSKADSVLDARADSAAERVLDSIVTGGPESVLVDTLRLPQSDSARADSLR